jgi:hypothetical protein
VLETFHSIRWELQTVKIITDNVKSFSFWIVYKSRVKTSLSKTRRSVVLIITNLYDAATTIEPLEMMIRSQNISITISSCCFYLIPLLFRFSNCDKNSGINATVNYFTIRLSRLLCNLINKISKRRFPKVKVLYRVCDDIVVKLKETNATLGNVPPQIRNRFFPELWKFYRSIKNS